LIAYHGGQWSKNWGDHLRRRPEFPVAVMMPDIAVRHLDGLMTRRTSFFLQGRGKHTLGSRSCAGRPIRWMQELLRVTPRTVEAPVDALVALEFED
jgi:hypothetical protein